MLIGCAIGTAGGVACGAGAGVWAVTSAALVACLPLCGCETLKGCANCCSSAPVDHASTFVGHKDSCEHTACTNQDCFYECTHDVSDKLERFVCDASDLVCSPDVALWGTVATASIGCAVGTSVGVGTYLCFSHDFQRKFTLLNNLHQAYLSLISPSAVAANTLGEIAVDREADAKSHPKNYPVSLQPQLPKTIEQNN